MGAIQLDLIYFPTFFAYLLFLNKATSLHPHPRWWSAVFSVGLCGSLRVSSLVLRLAAGISPNSSPSTSQNDPQVSWRLLGDVFFHIPEAFKYAILINRESHAYFENVATKKDIMWESKPEVNNCLTSR